MNPPSPSPDSEAATVTLPNNVVGMMRDLVKDDAPLTGPDDATIKYDSRPPTTNVIARNVEVPGMKIGNYVLKQELGRGGFGTVWWAEQVAPFKRDVALKIILQGMDSEEVIARFEAEKKLLAKMDHPNIAAVYDAGTTEGGRPFFVMEMVKGPQGPGKPITKYCDERHLSVRERIELFIPVCQAVQHAHMKQVLHRDLKPTNILVAEVDGYPVPKIIDFGISKAMSPDDEELLASRMRTAADMVIGTLQYMSPEQAGSVTDIDTRSDVYTLGVILYELLVGEPPIGREEVKKAVFDVLQLIREATPPRRPSTRWLSATEAQKQQAVSTRRTDPRRLSQQIHGDLDWIVLKALEKDRTRRYSAAMELADDLSRFLKNEPVSAGPPSAGYRLKKIIQRHKAAFAASVAVLSSIIVGSGVALWQWKEAVRARDEKAIAYEQAENSRVLAVQREKEARTARDEEARARSLESEARKAADDQRRIAEAQKAQAERERGIAQTARAKAEDLINYMLFDLRDKLEPLNRIGLLDDVAKKSEVYFKAQPTEGETDEQRRNRGGMWQNRGRIALALGRTEEAEDAFREFHRIMAQRAQTAPQDQQRLLDLAVADGRMSLVHEEAGRIADAQRAAMAEHDAVKRLAERADGKDAGLLRHLAVTYERLGDLAEKQNGVGESVQLYEEGHKILRALIISDPNDTNTQRSLATITERLADAKLASGDAAAALELYVSETAMFEELLAGTDADATLRRALAIALQKKAGALQQMKKYSEAEDDLIIALEITSALSSADPGNQQALHDLTMAHEKVAGLLAGQGRHAEAIQHWRRDLEMTLALAKSDSANARWQSEQAVSHWNLAQALLREGSKESVIEATRHIREGHDALVALEKKNALDQISRTWLATFEEAIQETQKLPIK